MTRAGVIFAGMVARLLARGYELTTPQELSERAARQHQTERYQVEKRQTRYTYSDGPMFYLGQQIVKAMEDAGYPAKIHECFRSPDQQYELYAQGRTSSGKIVTRALPFQSAHQLWDAVDIIHPERGWNVAPDYWETLAACVVTVSEKFGVGLDHGHHWRFTDSAHIELDGWHDWRATLKARHGKHIVPTSRELWERFEAVLPHVASQYKTAHNGPPAAATAGS